MNKYNNVYNALANQFDNNYEILEDMINNGMFTTHQMLDLFVNWHGLESLTEDFIEFAKDELEN